jgi:hypothetical protein
MDFYLWNSFKSLIRYTLHAFMLQMQIRCSDLPEISFFQGNMTDTDLPEESFDAVVDKALFDTMICSDSGLTHIRQYIVEVP